MKKKTIFMAIAFILLFAVIVSPAAAGGSAKGLCEAYGGYWVPASGGDVDNQGKCYYGKGNPSFYSDCGEAFGIIETWSFGLVGVECTLYTSDFPSQDYETKPDAKLDAWFGPCGVNLFSAPTAGTVTITKPEKAALPQPVPNLSKICDVSYVNSEGEPLTQWFSVTKLYHNLDATAKGFFDQGILNFYIYQDGEWTICPNMQYLPNEGSSEFGRVACLSSGPAMFGLGTELNNYTIPDPKVIIEA